MNLKIRRIRKSGSSVNSNNEPVNKTKIEKPVSKIKSVKTKEPPLDIEPSKHPKVIRVDLPTIQNSPEKLRKMKMDDVIIYFYEKYNGDWDSIMGAIETKEEVDERKAIKLVDEQCKDYDYTTVIDPDYPEEYKKMKKPPFVIKRKKFSDDKEY